jgi:hypothetical protein
MNAVPHSTWLALHFTQHYFNFSRFKDIMSGLGSQFSFASPRWLFAVATYPTTWYASVAALGADLG